MQIDSTEPSTSTPSTSSPAEPTATTTTPTAEEKEKAEKKERDAKRELAKKKKLQQELNQIGDKLPEADCFLSILVVISLLDRGEYEKVSSDVFLAILVFEILTLSRLVRTGKAILYSID